MMSCINQSKVEDMVSRLLSNAAAVKYGAVSVSVKLYGGKVVQVLFSTTENIQEPDGKNYEEK
jgi:hypothetical protein